VDMRSLLGNFVPLIGYEPLYDLTAFHENHYTQSYT
jgi:hypothetical protein